MIQSACWPRPIIACCFYNLWDVIGMELLGTNVREQKCKQTLFLLFVCPVGLLSGWNCVVYTWHNTGSVQDSLHAWATLNHYHLLHAHSSHGHILLHIYSFSDLLFVGPVLFFEVTINAVFSPQICIQVNVSARQISLLYTQEQFVFTLHCCWRCCASLPEGRCVSLVTRVAFCSAAPLGISEQSVCVCLQRAFVCVHSRQIGLFLYLEC